MTYDEIQTLVTDGLANTFQIDRSRITPEARLYEDLDLDSIDSVDLAAKLQSDTGIRLSPQDFRSIATIRDLVAVLEEPLKSVPADVPGETGDWPNGQRSGTPG